MRNTLAHLFRQACILMLACAPVGMPEALPIPSWPYLGQRDAGELSTPPLGLGPHFGQSIDAADGWVVVGAPFLDLQLGIFNVRDAGAVYLYRRDFEGGVPQTPTQVIRSAAPEIDAYFGYDVAIDGSTLMVGAPSDGPNSEGRVEFWQLNPGSGTWVFVNAFSGSASFERLGRAVALHGNRAAAGAPIHTGNSMPTSSGRVQVYARATSSDPFTATQSLLPPNPVPAGQFGEGLAILDVSPFLSVPDRLVVGEPNGGTSGKGLVWIYERSGGNFVFARVAGPSSADIGSSFGTALATTLSRVVIGASDSDRVLIEERTASGWSTRPPLVWPSSNTGFGRALDASGLRLLVGRPLVPNLGSAAYVYELEPSGNYGLRAALPQPGGAPAPWPSFGRSVAIDGRLALVGAPADDVGGVGAAGRVAVFAEINLFTDGFELQL